MSNTDVCTAIRANIFDVRKELSVDYYVVALRCGFLVSVASCSSHYLPLNWLLHAQSPIVNFCIYNTLNQDALHAKSGCHILPLRKNKSLFLFVRCLYDSQKGICISGFRFQIDVAAVSWPWAKFSVKKYHTSRFIQIPHESIKLGLGLTRRNCYLLALG